MFSVGRNLDIIEEANNPLSEFFALKDGSVKQILGMKITQNRGEKLIN